MKSGCLSFVSFLVLLWVNPLWAADAGRVAGTLTIDGKPVSLAFAASYEIEDLYDSAKKNTAVVLTDRAIEGAGVKEGWEIEQRARRGELVALTLRLDGAKLIQARINHAGIEGTLMLPGAWFVYRPAQAAAGNTAGSLQLVDRSFEGHAYAAALNFNVLPVVITPDAPVEEQAPEAIPEQEALPPATTSLLDPKSLTELMVNAMMEKDEDQVLKLLKLGADPNAKDPYGTPMLNWAIMMCLPKAVQSLVDAKADLTYERAPGLTVLTEAGACPEAEKILRAAGAR